MNKLPEAQPVLLAGLLSLLASLACNLPGTALIESTVPAPPSAAAASATSVPAAPPLASCFTGGGSPPPALLLFDLLPTVIPDYFAGGGTPIGFETAMRDAGLFAQNEINGAFGLVNADLDLNGDGIADLIVIAAQPSLEESSFYVPGEMLVFLCENGRLELEYQSDTTEIFEAPQVLSTLDLTGDGVADILSDRVTCGASTCFSNLSALSLDPATGRLVERFDPPVSEPYATVSVEDQTGDGLPDVVIDGGAIGSAGAGPQRTYTYVYAWDGNLLSLAEKTLTSPEFPIHILNDGDSAFDAGDYAGAIAVYRRSYEDPALVREWELYENWEADLQAYARYKIMLAQAVSGDSLGAGATYEALIADYPDANAAGGQYVTFARLFWAAYGSGQDFVSGCNAVVSSIDAENFGFEITVNQWGYANRYYEPLDMCPLASVSS